MRTVLLVALVVALGLLIVGATLIYPPAGFLVAGVGLAALVLFMDWGAPDEGS